MSYPTLSKKVLKNGEIMGPVNIEGRDIEFCDTSSYDSITEILSHAIQRSQRVKNYFEGIRVAKCQQKDHFKYSYAMTILNQAKNGPDADSYNFRETFLHSISDLWEGRVECSFQIPLNILTQVLDDGSTLGLCLSCRRISEARSLQITMSEVRDGSVEKIVRDFFASEKKICHECVSLPKVDALPLLDISTVLTRLPFGYAHYVPEDEMKASFDVLPVRLTVDGCVYVLCGVIEKVLAKDKDYHYVAFCRNVDGRWDKRDSFNEEIESLSELPVIHFLQIFYANLGYWDATERKSLIDPAISAWYRVTEIQLPELCVHEILGYLDNKQLECLIKGAEADNL